MDAGEIMVILGLCLAVAFLVLLNGFFVAAEFALVKVRDTQLQPMASKGHRRAKMARHLLANLDAYLSACQLGITIASLALGYVGHPIFEKLWNRFMTSRLMVPSCWIVIIGGIPFRMGSVLGSLQFCIL